MKNLFGHNDSTLSELSISGKVSLSHMAQNHFLTLAHAGAELEYYGADSGDQTFKVDGIVFKVLEDPDDGYRSHLGAIDYTDRHSSIFFRTPIGKVKIEAYDTGADPDDPDKRDETLDSYGVDEGYRLVDIADGHVWLEFGTHNYDDYYPMFIFRHNPKEVKHM